jgi:AcrR family transcriptional regulator
LTEPFGQQLTYDREWLRSRLTERFGQNIALQIRMMSLAPAASPDHAESAKRRQIMDGARATFLAQGFDGASMGEIARHAGVSKGTLYVYFDSKERLFQAIFEEERKGQAEQVFALDSEDHDVEAQLSRLGRDFVRFLCDPTRVSPLRTVISIADRMPELGKRFYETGPAFGVARVARYLEDQVAAGILLIEDCELAAAQFLDSCHSTLFKPLMFNAADAPSKERIDYVVARAVRTFLAAYAPR